MFSVALIGLSLSLDAFAVSVSSGISIPGLRPFHAVRAAVFFGLFQFFMPVAGWYLGNTFAAAISAWDHWIAFGLLTLVGGKMLWETLGEAGRKAGRKTDRKTDTAANTGPAADSAKTGADIRSLGALTILAFATSIDAMAVGLSFSILNRGIWLPAALIGVITLGVCLSGFEFGRRIGLIFERGARIAGGTILVGIGLKILLEHLAA